MQKSVIFVIKKFENKYLKDTKYRKVKIIVILQGNIEVLHTTYKFKYSVPKKIPAVFYNGCNYDYHLIIKELSKI